MHKSYCKINLRLKIEGRDPNGFHRLSMLNFPVDFYDKISIIKNNNSKLNLEIDSEKNIKEKLSNLDENLIIKAINSFYKEFNLDPKQGLDIYLKKNIPLGGGVGGGSSNAACTLNILKEIHQEELSIVDKDVVNNKILNIAKSLGADIPYFLDLSPSIVKGYGEKITKLNLEFDKIPVYLIFPKFSINTVNVYKNYREIYPDIDDKIDKKLDSFQDNSQQNLLDLIDNDLIPGIYKENPKMEDIYNNFNKLDDLTTGITGSGSTLFILSEQNQFTETSKKEILDLAEKLGVKLLKTYLLNKV